MSVYCAYCGSDEIVLVEDHDECINCGMWFSEDDPILEIDVTVIDQPIGSPRKNQ